MLTIFNFILQHNLLLLYNNPDIINVIKSRRLRWAGHAARMDENRTAYKILIGKPDGKRPLGRPRRRWEDNIIIEWTITKWGTRITNGGILLRDGNSGGIWYLRQ